MKTLLKKSVILIFLWLTIFSPGSGVASEKISGQVFDAQTGNPVSDATVILLDPTERSAQATNENPATVTNLAGQFNFQIVSPESFGLAVTHVSYEEFKTELTPGQHLIKVDLTPALNRLSEVVVTQGRGVIGETPGAYSNFNQELLKLSYGTQDVPLIAQEIPSATAFSWSGSEVGAAEIRIRGFGQNRINAMVNGIPINDPGDHQIYWQDTPDFLSNTHDLQVQRGVSNFLSGPAGVGGSLNLVTSDAVSTRELAIKYQAGSYNTQRQSLAYRSGMIEGTYNFTGRFSRVTSDGYRDHTGADNWSYFLAAARFDQNMTTRLQVYGGQEQMEAYWWGLDEHTLAQNRQANYSAWYQDYMSEYFWAESVDYHGEKDYFEQPHYVLHHQWRLSPTLELNQSLFYIQGSGYYEEWKPGRDFAEYNLTPFDRIYDADDDGDLDTVTVVETDLIRSKHVTKDQLGWLPKLRWNLTENSQLDLGLELRSYQADHWGQVMWARELPAEIDPQHEWYRWTADKNYVGGSVNIEHQMNQKLTLLAGVQTRYLNYQVTQEQMGAFASHDFELDWLFVNPRVGLTYDFQPGLVLYASFAGAGREPIDKQIYDADNPSDVPRVEKYGQSEIETEQMWDLELGLRQDYQTINYGVNFYGMFFNNEIIETGFSSARDKAIYDNVPTSLHVGIELDGRWQEVVPGLTLTGNLSYGRALLGDYEIEYIWSDSDWNQHQETLNLDGNRMALFPDLMANLRATYKLNSSQISLHVQHVGAQYLDNREDPQARLDPYTVLNGVFILNLADLPFGSIDLEVRGNNLMNAEYEPFGIVDVESGTPYYVPAAGRNYLGGITLNL